VYGQTMADAQSKMQYEQYGIKCQHAGKTNNHAK
jgi:hypothetical protein